MSWGLVPSVYPLPPAASLPTGQTGKAVRCEVSLSSSVEEAAMLSAKSAGRAEATIVLPRNTPCCSVNKTRKVSSPATSNRATISAQRSMAPPAIIPAHAKAPLLACSLRVSIRHTLIARSINGIPIEASDTPLLAAQVVSFEIGP